MIFHLSIQIKNKVYINSIALLRTVPPPLHEHFLDFLLVGRAFDGTEPQALLEIAFELIESLFALGALLLHEL